MHRAQDMRMPMQNNMPPGPGNDGPNGIKRPPSEPFTQQGIEHSRMMLGLVHEMERACSSPQSAGMIAIGSLKDDVQRKPEELAAEFEELLKTTKSLGLRNAIRLTLKDIYRMQNNNDKVLEHMRAMLAENDKAISENPRTAN